MSHHSIDESLTALFANKPDLLKEIGDSFRQGISNEAALKASQLEQQLKNTLGPTGSHPNGRLVPHDEGGLMFGITVFKGRVIFDFGKPIRSIGFTREGALELAELIKQRAEQCPAIFAGPKDAP